jgi:hypothetical protein
MTYYPATERAGESIWSLLENASGDFVILVKFSSLAKPDLGFCFIQNFHLDRPNVGKIY